MFSCFISGPANPPSLSLLKTLSSVESGLLFLPGEAVWVLQSCSPAPVSLTHVWEMVHQHCFCFVLFCFQFSHFEPCCLSLWCPTLIDTLVWLTPAAPPSWSPTLRFSFCISLCRDLFPSFLALCHPLISVLKKQPEDILSLLYLLARSSFPISLPKKK